MPKRFRTKIGDVVAIPIDEKQYGVLSPFFWGRGTQCLAKAIIKVCTSIRFHQNMRIQCLFTIKKILLHFANIFWPFCLWVATLSILEEKLNITLRRSIHIF